MRAEKTVDKSIELYCAEVADMNPEEARLHYWGEAVSSFLRCGTRFKDPTATYSSKARTANASRACTTASPAP
jgi:hypothetical protein